MAFVIMAEQCTGCTACEAECPNDAISAKGAVFAISAAKCTECEGHYEDAQCLAVCPVPGAVIHDSELVAA